MDDWPLHTIGDFVTDNRISLQTGPFGAQLHAHDYLPTGVAVIPTEAIRDKKIDHAVLPKISEAKAIELGRHRLLEGDILFARRGVQATGRTAIITEHEVGFICGTGAIRLRVKAKDSPVDARFLAHLLSDDTSIAWFKFHAIGATMPNLNEGIIRSFAFRLPPKDEQLAIAELLSALDDKIGLNRRRNETLEASARALFRDWFVDFGPTRAKAEGRPAYLAPDLWSLFPDRLGDDGMPEGWELGTLGDIARGVNTKVEPYAIDPNTPYIGLEHMPRRSIALVDWEGAGKVSSAKSGFKAGQVLFGKLRPYFHKVGLAPLDGICSTDIVVMEARQSRDAALLLACVSSDDLVAFADQGSTGTKMPRTSWSMMSRYPIARPGEDIAERYQSIAGPLLEQITANIHESRTLAATRDALLPKLMSGELRVREAEALAA